MKNKNFLATCICFFLTSSFFAQTTFYVNSGGNDGNSGTSTGTAFLTISHAVTTAVDGDTVIIEGNVSQDSEIAISDGKNLTFTGQSNALIEGNDANRLFNITGTSILSFSNITFNSISSTAQGAVLFTNNDGADITFTNCNFTGNSTTNSNGGGALFISNSDVTLTNCVFDSNTSNSINSIAGAIRLKGSAGVTATGTTFYNNSANNQGGAIHVIETGVFTGTNCTFYQNKLTSNPGAFNGAAIRVNAATINKAVISNSLFYDNTTSDSSNSDLWVNASSTDASTFTNSLAQSVGNATVTSSAISSNPAFLSTSNLSWNATENRVEYTAPDAIADETPIDFGNDTEDVGAWDSKINIFKGGAAGAVESWQETTNWSNGALPTVTDNVAILTGGACTLNTNATINDIKVTGRLDIANNQSLIVNGTAATGSGTVNFLRTLTDNPILTEAWHLVSSPLSNEVFDATFVTENDITENVDNRGIATYTTLNDTWSYLNTTTTTSINVVNGHGYSMKITPDGVTTGGERADGIVEFSGNFNTADVSTAIVTDGNGYNLLGNPYPAHINSATFLTDNTANLVSQTIWMWNGSSYDTHVTVDGFVIAPAQGFFIKAASNTNLNFAKSNQLETGGTFQKSSKSELKLLMMEGKNSRYAKLYFNDNATKGFDNGWDGETFGGIQNSLDVFTHLVENNQGKKYQVQSLPLSGMETMVVPVGVTAAAGKEITFSAETSNLPNGVEVYLEDRANDTFNLLDDEGKYTVTLTENLNGTGRFYLHTADRALSTDTEVLNSVQIFNSNKNTFRIVGLQNGNTKVEVYNILGKKVIQESYTSNGAKDIVLPRVTSGVYIVKLQNEAGTISKKIILE